MITPSLFLALLIGSVPVRAQVGVGFDLNPLIIGCVRSNGECLANSGIPIFSEFFGGGSADLSHYQSDEYLCYTYLGNWCDKLRYNGYTQCREAKKRFYKAVKQKKNDWNPPTGQRPNNYRMWTEEDYFDHLEKRGEVDFTCTPRQQHIWLKNRCGHTQRYRQTLWVWQREKFSDERWAREKTERCN